jgi:hypothetical protein
MMASHANTHQDAGPPDLVVEPVIRGEGDGQHGHGHDGRDGGQREGDRGARHLPSATIRTQKGGESNSNSNRAAIRRLSPALAAKLATEGVAAAAGPFCSLSPSLLRRRRRTYLTDVTRIPST